MPQRPQVVAFDVIETLFPIQPLQGGLEALGLPPQMLQAWFAASLRDSFALAAIGAFQPLRAIMEAALDDLLTQQGRTASPAATSALLDAMATLPPQADAVEAVAILTTAGLRVMALSNGGAAATESLLRGAGLHERVAPVVTTAEVRLSKPRREVYLHAAQRAGVEPGRLMLVAAHPWDTNGAKAAGLLAAFVARGRPYPAILTAPDLQGDGLADVARAIIALSD
ncbi:HAD-IA family hydrolase [Belnapia sp. T6]|uniref:HAD-IA family hydrolase n=1 Tax=Belnapia mucosa TaxID=2804532 RepID=A0ABS1V351_9PROT|nr:HAD-IA family hydrolase [Belnapia mucosa]MBL6456119.1 HAD-IA family hydrolase [Belnapia mucosa]